MGSQLQTQWDIGASTFSASDRIFSLLKAATVDDVQPLAVVAAEGIGSCLEVDPHLIGRAIDVLGDSESFRLENVKLAIGLSSGGIARQIKQSVSATRTFILMATLQAHLEVEETAQLLFEMLIHSGLHDKIATSRSQLKSLCKVLQGHCNKLNETEDKETQVWNRMLPSLASISKRSFWTNIIPEEGAKVILEVFGALREDDVDQVVLTGSYSGNWLAAIFGQLLPGRLEILDSQGDTIFCESQGQDARVKIRLDDSYHHWTVQKIYKIRGLSDILQIEVDSLSTFSEERPVRDWPNTVNSQTTYAIFLCRYCNGDVSILDEVEVVSLGLILLLLRSSVGDQSNTCRFRNICKPGFELTLKHLASDLGWPQSPKNYHYAYSSISALDDGLADSRAYRLIRELHRGGSRDLDVASVMNSLGVRLLSKGTAIYTESFWDMTVILTGFMLMHAICDFPSGIVCFGLNLVPRYSLSFKGDTASSALVNTPAAYLELIWKLSAFHLGLDAEKNQSVLAVSRKGYVAYFRCLKEVTRTASDACTIIFQAGSLKREDESYSFLYEANLEPFKQTPPKIHSRLDLSGLGEYKFLWRSSKTTSFQVYVKEIGSALFLHCKVTRGGIEKPQYRTAINKFALAYHAKPKQENTEQDIQFCIAAGFRSLPIMNSPTSENEHRQIITYSSDPIADFLRFSVVRKDRLCIIQGQASILQCVVEAERWRRSGGWVIFSNP